MKTKESKTILLVEDEAITAMAEAKMLERQGFTVLTALSGDKAIDISDRQPGVDLILMDIDLGPGMDGTQVAEIILKTKDIPVLFLSNHIEPEIVDKTEKITSYGYVVKNSGDTVLLASIRMAFRLHNAHHELRKREDDLKKSQKILSLIYDNTPNAITITDAETNNVIEANIGLEWTGWTREEIVGKNPQMLMNWVHPDTGNKIRKFIDETGKCINYRIEFFKKDGTIAHAIMNSILIQIDDRPHILTITNDVTKLSVSETLLRHAKDEMEGTNEELNATVKELEATNKELQATIADLENTKKEREQALAERNETEQRLSDLARFLPVSVFEADLQGRITFVNRFALELFGYNQEEVDRGVTLLDIVAPQDHKLAIDNLDKIKKGEQLDFIEYSALTRDGSSFPALVHSSIIIKNGQQVGIRGFFVNITEQKLAEEALRKSENEFRSLFEISPTAVAVIKDRRFLKVNAKLCEITGYSAEELVGSSVDSLYADEEQYLRVGRELYDMMKTHRIANIETRLKNKDGRIKDYHMIASPIDPLKPSAGVITTVIDITERKQAEEELKKFQYTIDQSSETVFWFDRVGGFKYVNDWACRSLGYTRDELLGMKIFDIDPVLNRERWDSDMERFYTERKGGSITFESTHRRKDGTTFPVEVRAQVLWLGEHDLHVSVARDISKRKEAEEALRQERIFTDAVLNSIPGLLYMYDDEGYLRRWNKNHETSTGYTAEELYGMHVLDWFKHDEKEAAAIKAGVERAFQNGQASEEGLLMTKSGEKVPYYFTATLLEIQGRKYFTGIGIDITERRQAEEALGDALHDKEVLLHELQHRMKNSLAMITGIIELEAVRTNSAGVKTVLNNLKGRIDSLTNLYTLLFQTNTVSEIALNEYIYFIVSSLTASYLDGMNTIRIEHQCDPLTVSVKNATAWGLIVNELLTNALKYAFPGDGTGVIRVLLKTSGGEASLSVSDNGSGPPPDFNIDRPSGFGLLLVNMLTRQLGGALSFARGTENVFTICAPVHE